TSATCCAAERGWALFIDDLYLALIITAKKNWLFRPAFQHQDQNVGMRGAIRRRQFRTADIESRRQGVSNCRRGGNHSYTGHAIRRPAVTRINNVAVPFAAILKKLFFGATGRKGRVAQPHNRQPPALVSGMTHSNRPIPMAPMALVALMAIAPVSST